MAEDTVHPGPSTAALRSSLFAEYQFKTLGDVEFLKDELRGFETFCAEWTSPTELDKWAVHADLVYRQLCQDGPDARRHVKFLAEEMLAHKHVSPRNKTAVANMALVCLLFNRGVASTKSASLSAMAAELTELTLKATKRWMRWRWWVFGCKCVAVMLPIEGILMAMFAPESWFDLTGVAGAAQFMAHCVVFVILLYTFVCER